MINFRILSAGYAGNLRLCAILALSLFFTGSLAAEEIRGKVIRVLDGDTLEVLQNRQPVRIRLANIDAPEKKQPFGQWSANQLKGLVAALPVTVTYTQTDRYGRILGRVYTESGTEVNRRMVQNGAAWVYERYNTDTTLLRLQIKAQQEKRGLWSEPNPVPPWEWRDERRGR
ncbi:hypothetical protein HX37_16675 [Salmonella enterica]|uniref:TNase-like domain-containing protein n=1 Tax=Salmonella enterica TaxID=28901 RepID=A0A5U2F6W3_SALER|nr:hypothetical protein [Salmonella enterica]EBH8037514.1 hypothetical protein [Salmonella bongori]ECG0831012.1 hypothetical protein [Salmonella enterica subsp. diarizonae]EAP3485604.1 hypothetical protein [Salmonella enterica]EBD6774075.1 hypothetical protein [Salmonella enterica]